MSGGNSDSDPRLGLNDVFAGVEVGSQRESGLVSNQSREQRLPIWVRWPWTDLLMQATFGGEEPLSPLRIMFYSSPEA